MIFNLNNQPFILNKDLNKYLTPKLFLLPKVIVSEYCIFFYSDMLSKYNLFGFTDYFDEEDDYDILVYDKYNLKKSYFHFHIPYNVTTKTDYNYHSNGYYGFYPKLFFNHQLPSAKYANYNKNSDQLSLYFDCSNKHNLSAIKVALDFYILAQNNKILGFCLNNSSKYLHNADGEHFKSENPIIKDILELFWNFYKEENFTKMENNDMAIKIQLQDLINLSKKEKILPVVEILEDWLKINY